MVYCSLHSTTRGSCVLGVDIQISSGHIKADQNYHKTTVYNCFSETRHLGTRHQLARTQLV
eukprot:2132141-Rhodomonas_salina.1